MPASLGSVIGHRAEVAVGMRVVQWTVFGKTLEVVTPLHHVKSDVGTVGAAERVARCVEIEAPGVPSPFRENLEPPAARVISPDGLLKLMAANSGCDRAALS